MSSTARSSGLVSGADMCTRASNADNRNIPSWSFSLGWCRTGLHTPNSCLLRVFAPDPGHRGHQWPTLSIMLGRLSGVILPRFSNITFATACASVLDVESLLRRPSDAHRQRDRAPLSCDQDKVECRTALLPLLASPLIIHSLVDPGERRVCAAAR